MLTLDSIHANPIFIKSPTLSFKLFGENGDTEPLAQTLSYKYKYIYVYINQKQPRFCKANKFRPTCKYGIEYIPPSLLKLYSIIFDTQ